MNLPQGWTIENFTSVVEIHDNLRKPINNTERELRINGKPSDKLFPYYGATGQIGYIDDYITDGEYVLLGEDAAPFLNPYINKAYIINGKTWVNNHAHVLKSKYNNKFLFYYLNYFTYNGYVTGTTRLKLTQNDMKRIPIINPPIPEQQRIVDKIDSLSSGLENGITLLKTIKAKLPIYRQAVLKWAFDGELTNTVMQEKKKLEDMCFFITKGTTPKKEEMSKNKGDIPFIKVYNLTFNGILDFTIEPMYVSREVHNNFLARSKVIPDDVLMNIVGPPLGKVSIIPKSMNEANINQAIVRFRCREQLDNKYLQHFLLYEKTIEGLSKQAKTTAGQINLTLEICRNLEIPICSKSEQQAIVSAIESRLSVCDKLKQTIDQTLALSASLRQSILKKAFEGRLVPQDPNDEPAEKLLERIRLEKAAVQAKQKQTRKRGKK